MGQLECIIHPTFWMGGLSSPLGRCFATTHRYIRSGLHNSPQLPVERHIVYVVGGWQKFGWNAACWQNARHHLSRLERSPISIPFMRCESHEEGPWAQAKTEWRIQGYRTPAPIAAMVRKGLGNPWGGKSSRKTTSSLQASQGWMFSIVWTWPSPGRPKPEASRTRATQGQMQRGHAVMTWRCKLFSPRARLCIAILHEKGQGFSDFVQLHAWAAQTRQATAAPEATSPTAPSLTQGCLNCCFWPQRLASARSYAPVTCLAQSYIFTNLENALVLTCIYSHTWSTTPKADPNLTFPVQGPWLEYVPRIA